MLQQINLQFHPADGTPALNKRHFFLTATFYSWYELYLRRVEDIRQEEVKESPQFMQVVLQWGSCQQQPVGGLELTHDLRELKDKVSVTKKFGLTYAGDKESSGRILQ